MFAISDALAESAAESKSRRKRLSVKLDGTRKDEEQLQEEKDGALQLE